MNTTVSVIKSPRLQSVLFLATLSVLMGLLSGCGAVKEEIWLTGGEQWKVNATLSLNQSERSMISSDLEQQLNTTAQRREEGGSLISLEQRQHI